MNQTKTDLPVYLQISGDLSRRIFSGEFPSGSKLPSTAEFAKKYGVTIVTMQKALQHTAKADLIERIPHFGTIVKNTNISRTIGIVYVWHTDHQLSPFYGKAMRSLVENGIKHGLHVKIYSCLSDMDEQRIVYEIKSDIISGLLKGLIILRSSPVFGSFYKNLKEKDTIPVISHVGSEIIQTVSIGINYLLQRDCKNILFVSMQKAPGKDDYNKARQVRETEIATLRDTFKKHRIPFRKNMVRYWGQTQEDGYREMKKIIASKERPDAFFINHDIIMPGVLLAIYEAGLKIPQDIKIICHANKDCPIMSPVPLTCIAAEVEEQAGRVITDIEEAIKQRSKPMRKNTKMSVKLIPGISCGEVEKI